MNIVTIDPSLSSTAICVNNQFFVYASDTRAKTKAGKYKKWFAALEPHVSIRSFDTDTSKLDYSDQQVKKVELYDKITDNMISDINLSIDNDEPTLFAIEGFSYSSATNALIDLVTYSTLLKSKLLVDKDNRLMVVSPMSLKVEACKLTYGVTFNDKGKELPCSNRDNVKGGKFTKNEILNTLLENSKLTNDWYIKLLKTFTDDLSNLNKVPNPIEDINDAKILYEILKNKLKTSDIYSIKI